MEKVESSPSAKEGREIFLSSKNGTSSFIILQPSSANTDVEFTATGDQQSVTTKEEIRTALKSKPFLASGNLSMDVFFKNTGELAPLRKVRLVVEEVDANGNYLRNVGTVKEYEGMKKVKETISVELPEEPRLVRILVDPVLRDDSIHVEVSKWYIAPESSDTKLEKQSVAQQNGKKLQPTTLELLQNYPNPFNPATTIEFSVPNDGNVKLAVFNSLGQNVATLFEGFAQSGYVQKVNFNASHLASGIYFSRLEYDGKTLMKKLVLMK